MKPIGSCLTTPYRLLTAVLLLGAAGCGHERPAAPPPPPVGHYEGSGSRPGQPDTHFALDLRHPSPGRYEAELTAPTAPALNFVTNAVDFHSPTLHLTRPGRPSQTLTLTLDGDFWRGTLALDSLRATVLLVRRGPPDPSTYRVEEFPQAQGEAWRFAPADTTTPGPALLLLPDAATVVAAPLWADALARHGMAVLLLPPAADSAAVAGRLVAGLRQMRTTAGVDSAQVGVWAAGPMATTAASALAEAGSARVAFFVAQNAEPSTGLRAAVQKLTERKTRVLVLTGGPDAPAWHGRGTVLRRRGVGANLLVPGPMGPALGPGLPGAVVQWVRGE